MIKTSKGSIKTYIFTIAGLSVVLLILLFAGSFPNFIEKYYAGGLYPITSRFLHFTLNWIPLSLGDILYIIIIAYLFCFVLQLVKYVITKRYSLLGFGVLKLIIGIQAFLIVFYVLWGMNYFRPPAVKLLQLPDKSYDSTELLRVTNLLIDSTNYTRAMLKPADNQTNNSIILETARQAIKQAGLNNKLLKSYSPAAKPALFTPLLNYMSVLGYFTPFTGEAQINYAMPLVNKPVTACHEMAHQMGFAREDEANFIGFMTGIQSNDRLLKYSAYSLAMQEFMQQVRRRDSTLFHQLKTRISASVKNDIKADRLYWKRYQNQIGYITGLFYDQYLKANNQPEGLRTYNRMINLTMAYYRRNKTFK